MGRRSKGQVEWVDWLAGPAGWRAFKWYSSRCVSFFFLFFFLSPACYPSHWLLFLLTLVTDDEPHELWQGSRKRREELESRVEDKCRGLCRLAGYRKERVKIRGR